MKLPLPFFQREKEEESEYYLALLLTDEKVVAVILHESLGKLKLLKSHEEFFQATIEDNSLDGIINLVDKAISKAEEILPPDISTHKTVFGVKEDWVEKETKKIKKEYLEKLKKVCDALDLKPIGFMVVTEAISHLLQENEGAPLSVILGDIGKQTISLNLFRGGKVIERIQGPRGESAPRTVDELLKHFTTAVLPARLIIYDGKDAETLSQEFISHQWSKALPFLHVPQVLSLPHGFDAQAVTYGAAEQMGFEVVGLDLQLEEQKPSSANLEDEDIQKEPQEDTKEEHETKQHQERIEEEKPEQKETSAEQFGFVLNEDIALTHPQFAEETEGLEGDNFTPSQDFIEQRREDEEEPGEERKDKFTFFSGFLSQIKRPHFQLPGSGRKKLIFPVVALVLLLIGMGLFTSYYMTSVTAQIVLSVKPEIVNQEETIVFSNEEKSDFANNVIAATSLATTVDGSLSIPTTGKKDVGEKAKGTVTIYNNDNKSVNLNEGATIKSSNGITFVLNKSVSVASASGDIFSGTKPGTANIEVTAQAIGTEGNLPSGTKFTIGTTSTLAAKNDSAFSGGTKKQVQVVSRNDIAKLRTELPKSLETKAKEAVQQKINSDQTLLPFITVEEITKEDFDHDVDDEATSVKLTASVSFSALAYQKEEFTKYASFLFKDKYSQDISTDSIKTNIGEPEENEDEQIETKVSMEAGLLPDIDTNDVTNKIASMSQKDALAFLSGLPQVADTKINFSPGIPFVFTLFPRLPNHIGIEVQAE